MKKNRIAQYVTSLFLLFTLIMNLGMVPPAVANQIWPTDCNFNDQYIFGSDEVVCVSGDLDKTAEDFIWPTARIYVTTNQTWPGGSLSDVTTGGYNVIQSGLGGGAFFDEYVWLPPLTEGNYDLVIDENQDGVYNGIDHVLGAGADYAFRVGPPVGVTINVAAIKSPAAGQAVSWAKQSLFWSKLSDGATAISLLLAIWSGDVAAAVVNGLSLVLSQFGIDFPTDYNAGVITIGGKMMAGLCTQQANYYATLAADPPDFNFQAPVAIDMAAINSGLAAEMAPFGITLSYPFSVRGDSPMEAAQVELNNLLAEQSGILKAFISSLEKFQGAELGGNREFMYFQAGQLKNYSDMLTANLAATKNAINNYQSELSAAGLGNVLYKASDFAAVQSALSTKGLSAEERQAVKDLGFSDAYIDGMIAANLSLPLPTQDLTRNMVLDNIKTGMDSMTTELQSVSTQAQNVLTALSGTVTHSPVANAGGPYFGSEGAPIVFDASASSDPDANIVSYAWDFDLDGQFDDGSGVSASWTWNREFTGMVGVKVTDAGGLSDIAYATVTVASVNDAPVIDSFVPASGSPTASVNAPLNFSVTAHDPDGDPLSYTWELNGVVVSTSTGWTYTPAAADSGTVVVRLTVSDGSPLSSDTYEMRAVTVYADADGDTYTSDVDCDDSNAAINPAAVEVCDGKDNNCVNGIDEGFDVDGDGYTICGGDCDDGNPNRFPGNPEVCDGVDNNCANGIDEGMNTDNDGDGVTECGGDCDDANANNYPGNAEVCDGSDNDCDGTIDEGFDSDGDGYTTCQNDCNDTDANIHPGVTEVCDGKDNNCIGGVDEGFDGDGDGVTTCGGDCNDADANNFPGNVEVCDGKDNNCIGGVDEGFDGDGDGYTSCGGDCDDGNAATHPGAAEICDSQDNNCDGTVDEGVTTDDDGDGVTECGGDCDDADANNFPGNVEVCDGKDNNCIGGVDEGFDVDGDGYSSCGGDCNDSDASVYPARPELFHNGKDDDCDAATADDYAATFMAGTDDSGYVYYAHSNGDGTWSNYTKFPALPGLIRGVAILDVDNDGDLDILAPASPGGNTLDIYLYENDGNENLINVRIVASSSTGSGRAYGMTAGDFNEDGNMDFIISRDGTNIVIGLGNGKGGFATSEVNTGFGNGREMDVADFDHDGHLDLVRATYSGGEIRLFKGNGDGTFTHMGVVADPGQDPYGVVAADFNNDGHPDIIGNYGSNGDTYFYAGNGNGTFAAGVAVPSLDFGTYGTFDNYDFNRDGNQDIVSSSYSNRLFRYFPGNGDGTFGAAVPINPSSLTNTNTLGISAPPGPPPAGDPRALIVPGYTEDVTGATVSLSGAYSGDDGSITSYDWNFDDGSTGTGTDVTHIFPNEGDYYVRLMVTDNDGKKSTAVALVRIKGTAPVADAGGPYVFGENTANGGVYAVTLDGSSSSDDSGIVSYEWNFGAFLDDTFDGTVLDTSTWDASGATQNNYVSITGAGSWGNRYLFSKEQFLREPELTFEARILPENTSGNQHGMFGFRDTSTNFSYTQMPHAIYFNNGSIQIYEGGSGRGSFASYTRNVEYEIKIVLKAAGAYYYFRESGAPYWTLLYDSTYSSQSPLTAGADVNSGTFRIDDAHVSLVLNGVSPTRLLRQGTYSVTLTVTDTVGQQDTDTTTITTVPGALPVSNPGGPYVLTELTANCGQWTASFDGSLSTDDSGIYQYNWNFGDGTTGTGQKPSHAYATAGNYTVMLTVTDNSLQTDSATTTVTMSPGQLPTANPGGPYAVDEAAANAGQWTVNLNGSLSTDDRGICDYQWNFGDGGTGTGATPSHLYNAAGTYTVTLTVRDHALQSHSASTEVVVSTNNPPVSSHGGPYSVDEGAASKGVWTVNFNGSGSTDDYGIWKYDWDFGDGTTGTGATPVHQYSAAGIYNVTLTVTDNGRLTKASSTTVTVSGNNPPAADAGPSHMIEAGFPVMLDASGSTDDFGIWKYQWDFGTPLWTTSGLTLADNEATITGAGNWTSRYFSPSAAFTRNAGDSYTGRIYAQSGGNRYVMWGLKADNNDYNYTQFHYAIYFNNNSVYIYEGGSNRGSKGTFTDNKWYDLRIDVKAAGATYYYRPTGDPNWTLLYDSAYSNSGTFRFGATVNSGTMRFGSLSGPAGIIEWPASLTSTLPVIEATYYVTGTYTPSVTVTDHASQTDTASTTVTVITGNPPVADAGGPYFTNEDVPTRFNGRSSTDDFGIKWYTWDFGDGQGIRTRNPWVDHRYTAAGTYTATLTVTDYAGHSSADSTTVNVSDAPVVACVPWAFSGGIEVPHESWSGKTVTLKGVAWSLHPPLSYTWTFGDGTPPESGSVSNKRVIQATHTYSGVSGQTFIASLTVTDANGKSASDNYYVRINDKSLDIEINQAIDDGLWWLHANENQNTFSAGTYGSAAIDYGYWDNTGGWGTYSASPTASAVQAFEVNGHLELGDVREDPYVETVARGLRFLPTHMQGYAIGMQTYGDPDTNHNGLGIETTEDRPMYEMGQVMDCIIASGSRDTYAITGPVNVIGRKYHDIVTDMADMYAWGQTDYTDNRGGGWRYSWNSDIDNSAAQWGAIGLAAAEEVWGITMPQWVKDRNNVWMTYSYNGTGFGYTGPGNGTNTTPSGLVQLAYDDIVGYDDPNTPQDDRDPRWRTAEDYIANNWTASWWFPNRSASTMFTYYGYYAFTKAMRQAHPQPVVNLRATGLDWFKDDTHGIARRLVNRQQADGSWLRDTDPGAYYVGYDLTTAWSVIILTPTLFVQPPVADAGEDRIWGVDVPITLDGSRSYHLDPLRSIVLYEWDVDGDGKYDTSSTSPTVTHTYTSAAYPALPVNVKVTLKVTDNNVPAKFDTDTINVTIAVPPHPPVAAISNAPYTCTAGLPCKLDGSSSFDIDPTDFITAWEWDIDGDFVYGDVSGKIAAAVFNSPGIFNVGLRVLDNAVLNDIDGDGVQDPEERLEDFDFATVTVVPNEAPVADAGGPYVVDEGTAVTLDGSGSYDPNGDPLTYSWDLDNDGNYDNGSGMLLSHTFMDHGAYTVGLEVSDTLLSDAATTTVIVNDLGPTAVLTGDTLLEEGMTGNYSAGGSTSYPDSIVSYEWDWNYDGITFNTAGTGVTQSHAYADNGTYIVAVRVTDDDGSQDIAILDVTVTNVPPVVNAGPDQTATTGASVSLDPATFTDEGILDTHTSTIDWGDGTVEAGAVTEAGGSGTVDGSHVYAATGIYTVIVTVTDDDGASGSDILIVTVDDCPTDPLKTDPGICGCGIPDTDTDSDGTADCIDQCPDDQGKTEPGICGCGVADTDSDGDGTADCIDQCPNDQGKTEPGVCGCGIPDTDTNGDGIPECVDQCPNDPLKTEPGICGCGTADTDSDGDGTADCNDNCPNDPGKTEPGTCGCGVADTDSDGDGTADCNDQCVADPDKTVPGICGCGVADTDSDGDGTADCNDNCPNDQGKTEPGDCGCGVADTDSDGDSVADCRDVCQGYDDRMDRDGDGIPDECDAALRSLSYELVSNTYNRITRAWTVTWKMNIRNDGTGDAMNVSARWTAASVPAGVTVIDDSVSWSGTVAEGATGKSSDTFSYRYVRNFDLTMITWDITYTDAAGNVHVLQNVPQH